MVGLGFLDLGGTRGLESWRFCCFFGGFCLGTLLNCIRLIWRHSLFAGRGFDRWKQAHKQNTQANITKKNTKERGYCFPFFFCGNRGRINFSRLTRRPGFNLRKRQQDKNASFFWPQKLSLENIHLPHPTIEYVSIAFLSFLYSCLLPPPFFPPQLDPLGGEGNWVGQGAMTISAFDFFFFGNGKKEGEGLRSKSKSPQTNTTSPDWKPRRGQGAERDGLETHNS